MENIINRIKNVLVSPKTEWLTIEGENSPHLKVFTGYVALLALIPAVSALIGYGFIGTSVFGIRVHYFGWGVRQAITQYITMVGGAYLTAFVIDLLSTNYGARKDFNKAFSLVAYAYTPMFIGGIFYVYPGVSWLVSLAGIYSLYLLYIGLEPMMQSPKEKQTTYFVVSLIVMVAVSFVLSLILSAILIGGMYKASIGF